MRAICSATFDLGSSVTLTARPGSGSVFAGWRGSSCGGAAPCTITVNQDTTAEAVEAYFGTPQEAFIERLYLNVLNQPPQNIQVLIDSLTPLPTLTRDALLDAFFDGLAFKARLENELTPAGYVTVLFRAILALEPLPEQRAEGIRALFQPLVKELIGSPEFQGRIGRTQDIVRSFYIGFLGREPTSGETATQVDRLNNTGDFLGVALELLSSDEYQQRQTAPVIPEHISIVYRGVLGRGPTATEKSDGKTQLRAIEAVFINRPEFQTLFSLLFPGP